jgi:hypothetical protein
MNGMEVCLSYGQKNYKWMINVNAVIISCKKEITADNVMVALRKLCQRHPNLRTNIVMGKTITDMYLAFFDKDPEPNLEVLDTEDWVATCEMEFENNFQEDELQWRVKMLKATRDPDSGRLHYPFVFSYSHAVVDGASIMAGIHTNFHRYLEDVVCDKDIPVTSLDFLPGMEAMFPITQRTILDRVTYKFTELFKGPLLEFDPGSRVAEGCSAREGCPSAMYEAHPNGLHKGRNREDRSEVP